MSGIYGGCCDSFFFLRQHDNGTICGCCSSKGQNSPDLGLLLAHVRTCRLSPPFFHALATSNPPSHTIRPENHTGNSLLIIKHCINFPTAASGPSDPASTPRRLDVVAPILETRARRSGRLRAVEHGGRANGSDAEHGEGARAFGLVLVSCASHKQAERVGRQVVR